MELAERFRWIYRFLTSKGTAAFLFGFLCLVLIPQTLMEEENAYLSTLRIIALGMTGINLLLCTVQRVKILPRPVLIIHIGALVSLAGGIISSYGYVATVNMYAGTTVDKAYRWDIRNDAPLGVGLTMKDIHNQYYPIPVKIGVMKGQEKIGLFQLNTGESFELGDYLVKVESMEFPAENVRMAIFNGGHLLGYADTSEPVASLHGFPYTFVLVAYKNPHIKRMWLDLSLKKEDGTVIDGTAEVNHPLECDGLTFYSTRIDSDQYGIPYAGVQITRDPGRPYVYAGFLVMGFGSVIYLIQLIRRFRRNG